MWALDVTDKIKVRRVCIQSDIDLRLSKREETIYLCKNVIRIQNYFST